VSSFDAALSERRVAWRFKERPSKVPDAGWPRRDRHRRRGAAWSWLQHRSLVLLIGGGTIAGGIVVALFGHAAVTCRAMVRAMLAAYRRTLQKTMAQARSMQQVVEESGLAWLDTPDQAVVWGTALGLQDEIEGVMSRSLEDVRRGETSFHGFIPYFPAWYLGSSGAPLTAATASGSGGGLFSNSGVPDIGGMMSALGTIGNSPSSSGSGGGGFSGGSSGGGGGGAGGGF
jgi:hypothetical protein